MNRPTQRKRKGCSFRKHGGGYGLGSPLAPIPADDWTYSPKVPIHQEFADCAFPGRTGQLESQANPALAQTPMAGGGCGCAAPRWGGARGTRKNKKTGGCGCAGPWMGGKKKTTRAKQRGGTRGFSVDASMSVGGDGPNAAPYHTPLPCDGRAGSPNPPTPNPDPRAPSDVYSLTGGAYSTGNAYPAECYRAPGSSLPVYNADSAGFHFAPSTEAGGALPDGVTPYNGVIQHAARLGGGRKRKTAKTYRK